MLKLIFTVCLIHAPNECEERTMTFSMMGPNGVPYLQCVMQGQVPIAKYLEQYPQFFSNGYRCEMVNHNEAEL